MYGTQAQYTLEYAQIEFENDVKMYGTQANSIFDTLSIGLRMM